MNQFNDIAKKVDNGIRLSEEDALYLYERADLIDLGQLADRKNKSVNGHDVYYNVNRHINPTNVCAKSCKFCAFSRKPNEPGAYELSIDEILEKARDVVAQGATEVHMVGGLHPRWRFGHYLEIIGALKQAFPALHIKAFTAVEIDWLAAKARLSIEDTLRELKNAGLGSMPGGGAEIFHPEIRVKICDTKTTGDDWIDIHRTAHKLGLRSNCTMLYGHIEQYRHRVDHMRRLRELQDETNGFNVFIPLAFQPQDNDMGINRYTMGTDDLRTLAVARLFLDNFKHIKAYWIMLGQDIAQLALNFGANDLDGTVTEEKISRMAGGRSGIVMSKQQIHNIVRKAGRIPVERDTLYKPVWRDPADDTQLASYKNLEKQVDLLLYKVEKGEQLALDEAEIVAKHGELLNLAHAARSVRSSFDGTIDTSFAPFKDCGWLLGDRNAYYPLDLASEVHKGKVRLDDITDLIKSAKTQYNAKISVLGLKRIWEVSSHEKIPLEQCLRRLKQAGASRIESSPEESELDLTNNEISFFHRSCHSIGLPTVAKVEFDSGFGGSTSPFWDRFLQRALELRKIHAETEGIVAVNVETGRGSFITPSEYMRALALTRIVISNVMHILTPFKKIPTIKPRLAERSDILNDPVFKIVPLVCYFGATDFGYVSEEDCDGASLVTELTLAGVAVRPSAKAETAAQIY